MKRDMELIREILLRIEEFDDVSERPLPDEKIPVLGYHLWLLDSAGLLTGLEFRDDGQCGDFIWYHMQKVRLTWAGHEFLDAARDDTTWGEAKSRIGKATSSVSLAVLTAVLIEIAKEKLGLPR